MSALLLTVSDGAGNSAEFPFQIGSAPPPPAPVAGIPPGYVTGFALAPHAADPANDMAIGKGAARDEDDLADLRLPETVKRLDALFAPGMGEGWRDAGPLADGSWHAFAIGGAGLPTETIASYSPVAPAMPAGYTWKRRIGSFVRAGGVIRPFRQMGNEFHWTRGITSAALPLSTTPLMVQAAVPQGISVRAKVIIRNYGVLNMRLRAWSPLLEDEPCTPSNALSLNTSPHGETRVDDIWTDVQGRIKVASDVTVPGAVFDLTTLGWFDPL